LRDEKANIVRVWWNPIQAKANDFVLAFATSKALANEASAFVCNCMLLPAATEYKFEQAALIHHSNCLAPFAQLSPLSERELTFNANNNQRAAL
jgi:hypothetical protein